MGAVVELRAERPRDVILEVLEYLWETKRQSIALLERWLAMTPDQELKVGLATHLAEERRHFRLLAEEIKRRAGRPGVGLEPLLRRPFALAMAQTRENRRVCAFYRGIKGFTIQRCGHLIPVVDAGLARTLEQIAREDERHLRWAEIRLSRIRDVQEKRQCGVLLEEVEAALELVWLRPWRRLTPLRQQRTA